MFQNATPRHTEFQSPPEKPSLFMNHSIPKRTQESSNFSSWRPSALKTYVDTMGGSWAGILEKSDLIQLCEQLSSAHSAAMAEDYGPVGAVALEDEEDEEDEEDDEQTVAYKQNETDIYPQGMICPLTHQIITDPVIDPEGNSYESSAIIEWLAKKQESPLTRSPLGVDELIPNRNLKDLIHHYTTNIVGTV